jgi:hypothetical protein
MHNQGTAGGRSLELRIYRMNAMVNGLVSGIVCGVVLFAMTALLLLKGGEVVGPRLALLGQYLPGYTVSWPGSLLGLLYGLLLGFIVGFAASWLYNLISRLRRGE